MPVITRRRAWMLGALTTAVLAPTMVVTADSSQAATTVTVAADGSGNYTTIQSAIAAVASGSTINIKPGTYKGQVSIPSSKSGLTLHGTSGASADVVITGNTPQSAGSASTTATMLNMAANTTIRNVTIANTYGSGTQALALYAGGDRQFYRNVSLKGHQDTFLSWTSSANATVRQYFYKSHIEGDVDFIYGNGTVVIDSSTIVSLSRGSSNNGYITASATYASNTYGILITRSTLTTDSAAAGTVALGRCWHPGGSTSASGQVLIRDSSLGAHVRQSGAWQDMSGFSWTTCRFNEYNNSGAGKTNGTSSRPQLSASTAASYTSAKYLSGSDGWNPTL
jgi:pectinesterase